MLTVLPVARDVNCRLSGGCYTEVGIVTKCRHAIGSANEANHDPRSRFHSFQVFLLVRSKSKSPRTATPGAVFQQDHKMAVQQEERCLILDARNHARPSQKVKRRTLVKLLLLYPHFPIPLMAPLVGEGGHTNNRVGSTDDWPLYDREPTDTYSLPKIAVRWELSHLMVTGRYQRATR